MIDLLCNCQADQLIYGQPESNIIEVYIRYLRQKLEEEGEPRLLHTVRGMGYVLREPD